MRNVLLAVTAASTLCLTATAHAENSFYRDPYDEAPHALRFADLELAMPTDPLLWSSDPGWEAHHTPQRILASAVDTLNAAIPAGTPAADAAALLHKAGARCAATSAAELDCRYRDVETPFAGEYWDNVTWRVQLGLTNGRVSTIAVSRDWTRR